MKLMDINQFLQKKLPPPLIDLRFKITSIVNFSNFFSEFIQNFSYISNQKCPFPDHEDSNPSFRAKEDGSYKCYGCGKSGSNIIQFWMHYNSIEDFSLACDRIYRKYVINEIPNEIIEKFHDTLKKDQETIRFLEISRGWHFKIVEHFKIGLYTTEKGIKYITIPIHDEYGYNITILYYNFLHTEGHPKFFYHKDRDNSSQINGLEVMATSKKVYIMEGQPDWLLALSLGLPAITFGSASVWKDSFAKKLRDYDVVIVYDSDDAGKEGARNLCNHLVLSARSIKSVQLPKKDFTEFLHSSGFSLELFTNLELATDYFKIKETRPDVIEKITSGNTEITTLAKAANAEYYGKRLRLIALVSGKEPSPFLIPRKMQMICQDKPTKTKCETCILAKTPEYSQVFSIDPEMKDILTWIIASSKDNSNIYRKTLKVNTRCQVDISIQQMWNVEKVILNNPVAHGKFNDLPERRLAFYFGTGLVPNRHYTFELYSTQHPQDNSVVHVLLSGEPLDTELENYRPVERDLAHLNCFRSEDIPKKFMELHEIISRNITRIWGRPILHLGLDLPFFSPNEFIFSSEFIRRASLDVIVFGDQRCGKGRVAEGLSNYYRFGEVLSGENTSFMNLVGGIESNDTYRGLKWGRIVANNGGVIIIDEASALETDIIAKLSRIRSEGLAELDKYGIHAKALARCSIIWLSNTRGESLSKFNFGVEALKNLIGQPEDIARFDYAIAVRTNEVDPDIINRDVNKVDDIYGDNLHRALILWCKTRRADQVIFTRDALEFAYEGAKILGASYSSEIPLLQVENARIKLAKIAAAIAGRLFSSSDDYQKLIVKREHMEYALQFLNEIYTGEGLGYSSYSSMTRRNNTINYEIIDLIFQPIEKAGLYKGFLTTMLGMDDITIWDLGDATGLNQYDTRRILGQLLREGALQKVGRFYKKSEALIQYIKTRLRKQTERELIGP